MTEFPALHVFLLMIAGSVLLSALCLLCGCYMLNLKKHGKKVMNASLGYEVISYKESGKCLNVSCPICLEDFKKRNTIAYCKCRHAYHVSCLTTWLKVKNTCPLCQQMPIAHV
ncbi:RING finger protein 24 [Trichoplax sp. H2]|nr:RING finger protein 24 [Trichoplax sp. H2]|eukprot:RDD41665.1 RING finger protein 24 [Trichoplax sp. H2]